MNQIPMANQYQQNKTVLFISELPENILNSDLEFFFQDYKDNIIMIQVDTNSRSFDSYGIRKPRATIIFKDPAKASEARNALNMRKLKGKTLNIMWHEKDNSIRYNNTTNVFVKGIPASVKPREFYELFAKYGEIISSKLCEDEEGNSHGYGYINYFSIDSAEKVINELNGKEFFGSTLEVTHFQKKNERISTLMGNNGIYVKNFPSEYTEEKIKKIFSEFGTINFIKEEMDSNQRKFAIVVFSLPESAIKAKEALNMKKLDDSEEELYVDLLQKKSDRKRFLFTKIRDLNSKLNQDYKNCNLHIRNIPLDLKEEQLKEAFSEFGEVKSVKIPKFLLETKIKGELKEYEQSRGFGYLCFKTPESAQKAIDKLNGKYLPGYEGKKCPPLIISIFMPKNERRQILSKIQGNANLSKFPMVSSAAPAAMFVPIPPTFNLYPRQFMAPQGPHRINKPHYPKRNQPPHHMPNKQPNEQYQAPNIQKNNTPSPVPKEDEPNVDFLNSLDGIEAQKEYLGEFLFKKIEQHPLSIEKNLGVEIIGRITGMILGIGDIKEIYDITMNKESLTARINEALNLLQGNQGDA